MLSFSKQEQVFVEAMSFLAGKLQVALSVLAWRKCAMVMLFVKIDLMS